MSGKLSKALEDHNGDILEVILHNRITSWPSNEMCTAINMLVQEVASAEKARRGEVKS